MRKILFVDDDQNLLRGLKRGLHHLRTDWDMTFVDSGEKALSHLATDEVDIIISDYRMPRINGFELLFQVREKYPHIVRIMLTGQPDKNTYRESINHCHYFLWKPFDTDAFITLLNRFKELDAILSNDKLTNILRGISSLPSLPAIYAELTRLLDNPESDLEAIVDLIRNDVALTMQVLKLVNSAFIGLVRQISSLEDAVQYLGLNTLRSLVLAHHVFSINSAEECKAFELEKLWQHSFAVARLAEALVRDIQDSYLMAHASFGGLLHDVGKLILIHSLPDSYRKVLMLEKEQSLSRSEAERRIIGTDHAAAGAYLAGLWGLPHSVVVAILLHHQDSIVAPGGHSDISVAVWHANRISLGDFSQSAEQRQALQNNPETFRLLARCWSEDGE